jgi:hypothetical protein
MRPQYPFKGHKAGAYHQLPDVHCASAPKPFPMHVTMLPRLQVRLNQCARSMPERPSFTFNYQRTMCLKASASKTRGNILAKDGVIDKAQKLKMKF